MTEIYLIRHGEAEGNYYRRAQGVYDSNITPLGRRQLAALAERFRAVPLDGLYCSDLTRAKTTAAAIGKYHPALTAKIEPGLRELSIGIWEDTPWGNLSRDWPEQMDYFARDPGRFHVPGSEDFFAAAAALERTLAEIAEENEGKTVAVVSHGMVIRALLCRRMAVPSEKVSTVPHGDNTAVCRLLYESGRFTIDYYNDSSHLPPELSTFSRQSWWRHASGRNDDDDNTCITPMELDADAALYAQCYENTWIVSHGTRAGFNETVYLAMARGHVRQDPELLVRMDRAGEFAGLIELDRERGAKEKAGWISLIYCEPGFRGRRLGIQLLGHAVSYFRRQGFERIRLHVSQTNTAAIGFYEYNGFRALQSVQGVGGELWLMEMDIRRQLWRLP